MLNARNESKHTKHSGILTGLRDGGTARRPVGVPGAGRGAG